MRLVECSNHVKNEIGSTFFWKSLQDQSDKLNCEFNTYIELSRVVFKYRFASKYNNSWYLMLKSIKDGQ